MKKEVLIGIAAFFLVSFMAITGVYSIDEKTNIITISKDEMDITGDGIKEVIQLKGVSYQGEDSYLKKIFIEITSTDKKLYKFPIMGGAKASLQVLDLNHDGVKDLFVSVSTGGSGGIINNYLYSFKDFIQTDLTVPDPLNIESRFLNGYQAQLKIEETNKTYLFDLKDRKKYYKKLGLYYKGKINEPTELTVNLYSTLKPIPIKGKEMGLKGIQRVTGVANADTIAYIKSFWRYEEGKWKLVNAKVQNEEVGN